MFLFISIGQSRVFKMEARELIEARDSVINIDELLPSEDEFDFLSEDIERVSLICLSELKSISRNRPDELKTSETLATLARLATKAWRGSQYADKKKWGRIAKHFRRAFERSTSKFNYTKQVSFRIKLVQNNKRSFYCDKKVGISETNLYKGNKPKHLTKAEKEELPDPVPLANMTEVELLEQFIAQVKRKRILSDLKKGRYAFVGVSIQVDENTMNRNRIPTARVVLVLGARRLRNIKMRERYYVKGKE